MIRFSASALVLGGILLAPAAASALEPSGALEIHYINPTTQAGVTLVIGPDGTTVLMDAGKAGDFIPDYLAAIGLDPAVDHLDYTIAGHLDADHIRGFKDVIGEATDTTKYNVPSSGENYFNGSTKSDTQTIADYKAAVAATDAGKDQIPEGPVAVPLDTVISLGDGATLQVVAVNGAITGGTVVPVSNENDRSIAVVIRYGDFDFVWASDLGGGSDPDCTARAGISSANVEEPLAEAITLGGANPLLPADGVDVLHVSHHGAANSTNCHWMALLRPEVAVMQTGNADGNPEPVVVDDILRVGAAGPGCTCLDGVFPALVLQTDEGDFDGGASTTGYVVGDLVISTDGTHYWLDATGAVRSGSPDERSAAGLPAAVVVDDLAPGCPMEQVLPAGVVTTAESWKAKHRILTDGTFTVGAGGDVLLEAGTRVELSDGFTVESGGSLTVAVTPLTDCS